jgi:Kef-type K+ transport system membrane component KefB
MVVGAAAPAAGLTPPQVTAFVLADVAVILIVARLCAAVAHCLGQPVVVGEIVAGVLLGPTLLGPTLASLADPPAWLACQAALAGTDVAPSVAACLFPPQAQAVLGVLGKLALLLFSFLVGLDLNVDRLKGCASGIALVAVGSVAVPVGAAFLLQPVLYTAPFTGAGEPSALAFNLFVGALLAVFALPVMARILQEKALLATRVGAVAVTAAAVVTVSVFVLAAVASSVAGGAGAGGLAARWR